MLHLFNASLTHWFHCYVPADEFMVASMYYWFLHHFAYELISCVSLNKKELI